MQIMENILKDKIIDRTEEFLSLLKQAPKSSQFDTVITVCFQFLNQSENISETSSTHWSHEKLNDYSKRIHHYKEIIKILEMLKINPLAYMDQSLYFASEYSNKLFKLVEKEFINEYLKSSEVRQNEIIEEIFVPHLLIVKFIDHLLSESFRKTVLGK